MVYVKDSKFIAVVTHKGRILRDFKNEDENFQVKLPFGEEYGLRFKNMNTTRVAVSVSIDGEDALDGSRIVIEPNESHDLEGFMKGSTVKNRFKFIEKTEQISEHRGDRIDDGIVRIEYQFEKKPAVIEKTIIKEIIKEREIEKPWKRDPWVDGPYKPHDPYRPIGPYFGSDEWTACNSNDDDSVKPFSTSNGNLGTPKDPGSFGVANSTNVNEDGITVKGSQANIKYKTAYLREMEEQTHVMILNITGYKANEKKIVKAVTTTDKIICPICGTKNKSSNKFCTNCGACLV